MSTEEASEATTPQFNDIAEEVAYDLVPRVLGDGVRAEPHDHSGRQGAVDFLLHYPDGRIAAMEVPSVAGDGMRQLYAHLAEHETLPNPGKWTWSATIDDPRDLPELLERCSRIVLYCEANGIAVPKHAYGHRGNADIAWVITSTADLYGTPSLPKWDVENGRERPLFLTPGGRGGSVDESLSRLAEAINELIAQDHVQRRIRKLDRSGHEEQHLFVVVDHTGLPFDVFYALTRGTISPPNAPILPGAVTHLWLLVTFTPHAILVTAEGIRHFARDAEQWKNKSSA